MRIIRVLRFIWVAARPTKKPNYETRKISTRCGELVVDIYRPKRRSPFPALVLGHGLNRNGASEPRLIQLAEALRSAGYLVWVPDFKTARELRLDPGMADEMDDAIEVMSQEPGVDPGKIGAMGISHAGTLALRVAAAGKSKRRMAWVATLGSFLSFENLADYSFNGRHPAGGPVFQVPPDVYVRDILVGNFPELRESRDPMETLRATQREFVKRLSLDDEMTMRRGLNVLLLHSPSDPVIPYPEMDLLRPWLEARGARVTSLLVSLKSHAELSVWKAGLSAIRAVSALLRLVDGN